MEKFTESVPIRQADGEGIPEIVAEIAMLAAIYGDFVR